MDKSMRTILALLGVCLLACVTACTSADDDACNPGDERECGITEGACEKGWQKCEASGAWGAKCLGAIEAVPEECDGIDNDCDGLTDNLSRTCENRCGEQGVEVCVNGEWDCPVLTPLEICGDFADNDCDGSLDESCGCQEGPERECGTDVGICEPGLQYCKDGFWTSCEGAVGPQPEVCDGLDNDCDNQIDEGLTQGCSSECGAGIATCVAGNWVNCTAPPAAECAPQAGDKRPCGTNTGECVQGEQEYQPEGGWGPCVGSVGPSAEACDGKDNNCNGITDDTNEPCTNECTHGVKNCDGVCTAPGPQPEVCDCKDNDCDGLTDEDLGGNTCTSSCGTGTEDCISCRMQCNGPPALPEQCDNIDNDCDGATDDNLTEPCEVVCNNGVKMNGTKQCQSGGWGACQTQPCPN